MVATERMASADAAWLHMDRPTNLMVVTCGPIGVGLSICSYAADLQVGVAVDEALVPDSNDLLAALAEEVATFRELQ